MGDDKKPECNNVNQRAQFYDALLKEFRMGFQLLAKKIINICERMDRQSGKVDNGSDAIVKLRKALRATTN